MDEIAKNPVFSARLEAAMKEPAAPKALVERTVARVKAIEMGREAFRTLTEKGGALSPEEKELLAAKCVVGQLLQSNAPRVNVNGEKLAEQLRSLPSFRNIAALPREELGKKLADGGTVKNMVKHLAAQEEKRQQPPVIEAPVRTRPDRSLPGM